MGASNAMIDEGYASFRDYRTWYRVTGDPRRGKAAARRAARRARLHPRLCRFLHRPGRRPAGRSSTTTSSATAAPRICRDKGADFWTVDALPRRARQPAAPSSASPAATTCSASPGAACWPPSTPCAGPQGLRALVIADSPASMELWLAGGQPAARGAAARRAGDAAAATRTAGTTDSAEYAAAVRVFYDRHVCRVPWPPEVARTFAAIDEDPTVYHTMNGPSEFHVVGHAEGLEHHRPARPHRGADAADLRPLRRGHPGDGAALRRPHPRRALGDLREFQPHAPCRGDGACLEVVGEFLAAMTNERRRGSHG